MYFIPYYIFSIVSDLGSCIAFLQTISGFSTKPTKTKVILEITSDLKIACDVWKKCVTESIPTLKKESKETYDPTDSNSGAVKIDRVYRTSDEDAEEVLFEERIKGYKYGPQYIPVSLADEVSLKLPSEDAVIRTLGFVPAKRIARHHFLETASIVEGLNDASARAVSALAVAMAKSSQLLVARYVKKKDSDVVLVVLIPSPSDDGTLVLQRIPCTEDFRNFPFPHMIREQDISSNQKTTMANFVDALTKPYDPSSSTLLTYNAPLLSVQQEAQKRVLNLPVSPTDISIASPFTTTLPNSAKDSIKSLYTAFPLEIVEQKASKKRKMYWSDIEIVTDEPGFGPAEDAAASQEVSTQQTTEVLIEISSLNPIEDFERLVKIIPASSLDTLYSKMVGVVEQLITEGGSNAHFRKAIGALKVISFYRTHMIVMDLMTFENVYLF